MNEMSQLLENVQVNHLSARQRKKKKMDGKTI
jgi:hypothetical protein